ncbi:glutathione S-transferase family protein [Nisaea acidiphila]|uniref:Glutathione S-transferase family protein n=1 Tax=Nisaea acidiphila TaxID=1862145 RepID=A0A9J7AQG3_9PROT|nr:glutathione S-transferase family protein [Nisaea acidiphila]UUX49130.1 glutathione S-transferase family protein [Nisaea acidiphila]
MSDRTACYRLYWTDRTAALLPQYVLEEAGIAHEIVPVDLTAGEQRSDAFLARNPAGKVPALELPEGGFVNETAAICQFLIERHGLDELAPPPGDPYRGAFLQWLSYLSNSVQPSYKLFYYPHRYAPAPGLEDEMRAKALELIRDAWRPVERHLAANGPCHLGGRFSLLEAYLAMLVMWFPEPAALLAESPAVRVCFAKAAERPAAMRCLGLPPGLAGGSS